MIYAQKLKKVRTFIALPENASESLKIRRLFYGLELINGQIIDIDFLLLGLAYIILYDILQDQTFQRGKSVEELVNILFRIINRNDLTQKMLEYISIKIYKNSIHVYNKGKLISLKKLMLKRNICVASYFSKRKAFGDMLEQFILRTVSENDTVILLGRAKRDLPFINTILYTVARFQDTKDFKKYDPFLANIHNQVLLNQPKKGTMSASFLYPLLQESKTKTNRVAEQKKLEIPRENWRWSMNPLFSTIMNVSQESLTRNVLDRLNKSRISSMDFKLQLAIQLTSYPIDLVWISGKEILLKKVEKLIREGKPKQAIDVFHSWQKSNGHINKKLLNSVAAYCIEFLQKITRKSLPDFKNIIDNLNDTNFSPFTSKKIADNTRPKLFVPPGTYSQKDEYGNSYFELEEKQTHKKVTFKAVSSEINAIMGETFHYLHNGRPEDEIHFYGAFISELSLPFAWISFAKVDRGYKKEMYEHVGIEPHRILEITRGWAAPWSPKNTMSALCSFAMQDIVRIWDTKKAQGLTDKSLAGFGTVVNPNLGFEAHWLRGVQMITCGLRPAYMTFLINENGHHEYMTRRALINALHIKSLEEIRNHPKIIASAMPLLPINEMILPLYKRDIDRIKQLPIYVIPEKAHERD